jgi:tetratricopeptide (TPR) repeat protein
MMKFPLGLYSLKAVPFSSQRPFRFSSLFFLACLACCPFLSAQGQKVDAAALELRKGKLLYAKHDLAGAIASYSKAIEIRPDWAAAYLQRGYARRMQGDLDKAIEDYDKATELDPASTRNDATVAEAYVNQGFIRKNRLQIDEALTDYDKAIKVCPARTPAYLQRGQARILNEDFAGAIADFDYFIANERYDSFSKAFAYADRSLSKRLLGKTEEADKDLQESLRLMKGKENIIEQQLDELAGQLLILRQMRPKKPKIIAQTFRAH